MSDLWVERYRPMELDDIVGHNAVVTRMKAFVDDPEMPNLLFAGPQGIGKTAIVQAFAREKYGDDWRNRLLELNASDDRGIDVVRNRIKSFARLGAGEHDFKIVFLDEADQLTNKAQPALRRTMEDYSDTTRFILSCNYPGQIIDPIQSRCGFMRLTPLADDEVKAVLKRVVDGEGISVEDEALDRIVRATRGDARHAIHTLHLAVLDGELTVEEAADMLAMVDYDRVKGVVDDAIAGKFDDAMGEMDEILKTGVAPDAILRTLLSVIKSADMPEDSRVKAIDALGDADIGIRNGANPHVQLHSLIANILVARYSSTGGYDGK